MQFTENLARRETVAIVATKLVKAVEDEDKVTRLKKRDCVSLRLGSKCLREFSIIAQSWSSDSTRSFAQWSDST